MRVAVEKLAGVEHAEVSLNEGLVRLTLRSDNKLTIARLRRTIRDQGFSPKEATVIVSARIERRDGGLLAVVGSTGSTYRLTVDHELGDELAHAVGRTVILEGTVPQDADDDTPDHLQVTRIVGDGEPRSRSAPSVEPSIRHLPSKVPHSEAAR